MDRNWHNTRQAVDPAACLVIDEMDTSPDLTLVLLEKGTQGGNPTVTFQLKLSDGRVLYTQTTLKLFLSAADVLKASHEHNVKAGIGQ